MSKRKYHLISHLGNTGKTAFDCFGKSSQASLVEQTMQFSSFAALGEKAKQLAFFHSGDFFIWEYGLNYYL